MTLCQLRIDNAINDVKKEQCDITAHTVLLYALFCLIYMYCTLYVLYILHTVHGYEALTIGAVDISSSAVAGQVSDTTGKTGRTFVFVEVDLSTTIATSSLHGLHDLHHDRVDHSRVFVSLRTCSILSD